MMEISRIIIKAYGNLLKLYPTSFRKDFEEQMMLDFSDGGAFALLFAKGGRWVRYSLVYILCWFLHQEVFNVWFQAINLHFFLERRHFIVLSQVSSILSGAFLGLMS